MVYGPQGGIKNSSEVSYGHLLDSPLHSQLQKVEVELIGWLSKPMRFDKKVLSLIEKVNKNYRLPFERLYRRRIFENHEYRKNSILYPCQLIKAEQGKY
jgi:hypothetical protein